MKKLVTIALTIALVGMAANADPSLEFDPTDLGGGLTGYRFFLQGNDGIGASFATTNLRFTGDIRQMKAFGGFVAVDVEGTLDPPTGALGFNSNPGAGYDMNLDTWLYNEWTDNSGAGVGNETNLGLDNGNDVVLTVGSATGFTEKDLVYIVAGGDLNWAGDIHRTGGDFPIEGSTAGGGQPGESQENPIMPGNGEGPRWEFNGVPGDGQWFDPPMVPAYEYETDGASNFVTVQLPVGLDGDGMFIVNDGNGGVPVAEGVLHTFAAPVTSFIVSGIDPAADAGDPVGFPTFLSFDQQTVSFTQTGIPEPATMGLMLFGAIGMIARKRRR